MLGYLPSENETPRHPTIGQSTQQPSSVIQVAWEDQNQIYYTYFFNGSFGEIEEVTLPTAGIEINTLPSLSVDLAENVNVVWSGFDVTLNAYVLLHRQRGGNPYSGQWGELNEIYYSYSNITQPTIGSFIDINKWGWFNVAFNFNNSYVRAIQYQVEGWQWLEFWENGKYPSLGDHTEDMMAIWTDHTTGLPYLLKDNFFGGRDPEEDYQSKLMTQQYKEHIPELEEKHFRKEIFQLSHLSGLHMNGNASLTIGDIQIHSLDSSWTWEFIKTEDSLYQGPFLQTESIPVTPNMLSAVVHYRAELSGFSYQPPLSNYSLFGLRLLNGTSMQPVTTLNNVLLSAITGPNFSLQDTMVIDLRRYSGSQLVLDMQSIYNLYSLPGLRSDRMNIYEYYPVTIVNPKAGENITSTVVEQIPHHFSLDQNYPNPFNPTTTITFDLPEDAIVDLAIYDITGCKIKTLFNEPKEAGTYQVIWNGQDDHGNSVASGVYVYRIQAGDFVQSKKLLFMK